jgi:hypothetical protein
LAFLKAAVETETGLGDLVVGDKAVGVQRFECGENLLGEVEVDVAFFNGP